MTAVGQTLSLASFEFRGIARSRWVLVGGAVFAAAAAATVLAGLRSFASLGLSGAGAATDGLLHVVLSLPPLVGLLLGAGGLARDRERGLLAMTASQPIERALLPAGSFLGSLLATWAIVAIGVGTSILLVSAVATLEDLVALAWVLVVGLAAASCAVALGVLLSALASTHHQATAAAAALWLLLALGVDLLLAGVAPGLRLGPAGLLAAVLFNPLEAARVLGMLLLDGPAVLGPFGAYLVARLGGAGARWLLMGSLFAWTVVPLACAGIVMARRDA